MGIFFASAWRRRRPDDILLAFAAPWCLADDLWVDYFAPPLTFSIGDYTFLPLYGVIGWILLRRFAQSLNESEQLNAELEQRVEQKQVELQANFQRLQQLERDQAIAEERSRIMSDMHDGIGAQLISTLGMAEHGQLSSQEMAAALRECLDDLRLTIDSMEPTDNDLLPALGNFRYRVDPRLKRQGITLDWQVGDVPRLACLTPRNLLHLLRILQEAFTNVLKHAGASLIRVETGLMADEQQVFIRVSDNGAGFSGDHRGRGLANMRQRAEHIGGVLQIAPGAVGTMLELRLPVA
jgi:signal transduction histidine kinase